MAQKSEVDYLNDQISILDQQITSFRNEKFQHELVVEDARAAIISEDKAGASRANAALRAQATNAQAAILALDRRIEVREKMLAECIKKIEEASASLGLPNT